MSAKPSGLLENITNDRPINFIESLWSYLSPFSAHQIEIWGEIFPTVEHAYHWARFKPGPARDAVYAARSPLACLEASRVWREKDPAALIASFDKEATMETLFRAKLEQHTDVFQILKLTESRGLLKEIPFDYYWGTGADGSGENRMGKLWMKLRSELFPLEKA